MRKLIALLLALTFIFALAACEKETESSEPPPVHSSSEPAESVPAKKIGISLPNQSLQRWERDGSNMKSQLEDAGYEVELQYAGDDDISTQIAQVEEMISGGCDALVIAAIDSQALTEVLEGAKEKKIPVIAYDRFILGSDALSYYASFDNYAVGSVQAKFILDALNLENVEGSFNMELFTGDPGDSMDAFYRPSMTVFQDYIDKGKLVIPSGQIERSEVWTEGWSTENAQKRMKTLIKSEGYGPEGEKLDAVWCANDTIARGVTKALLDAGYSAGENFPIITGMDCDLDNIKNMLAGIQSMSIIKDTRVLVSQVVAMINSIMKGEEPEVNNTEDYDNGLGTKIPTYLCMPIACTAENYKDLLIDSGYYTEEELK